jgi:hypothetical protein
MVPRAAGRYGQQSSDGEKISFEPTPADGATNERLLCRIFALFLRSVPIELISF